MQDENRDVAGEAQSAAQPMPFFGTATPVTALEGPFAELTLRVAFDGLSGKSPELPPLAGGTFGPFDLAGFESTPRVDGLELKFPMQEKGDGDRLHVPMAHMNEKMNLPTSLRLEDGSAVGADLGFFLIKETRFRVGGGPAERDGVLTLDHWVHGAPPAAWFGIIEGVKIERGNIYISEGEDPLRSGRVARAGMRLQGNYLWHLIERDKECAVLIDTRGARLNPRLLSFDFHALQVTFGKPLRLGVLSGLDESGQTRCWAAPLSGGHRRVTAGNPYGPSPLPDGGPTRGVGARLLRSRREGDELRGPQAILPGHECVSRLSGRWHPRWQVLGSARSARSLVQIRRTRPAGSRAQPRGMAVLGESARDRNRSALGEPSRCTDPHGPCASGVSAASLQRRRPVSLRQTWA